MVFSHAALPNKACNTDYRVWLPCTGGQELNSSWWDPKDPSIPRTFSSWNPKTQHFLSRACRPSRSFRGELLQPQEEAHVVFIREGEATQLGINHTWKALNIWRGTTWQDLYESSKRSTRTRSSTETKPPPTWAHSSTLRLPTVGQQSPEVLLLQQREQPCCPQEKPAFESQAVVWGLLQPQWLAWQQYSEQPGWGTQQRVYGWKSVQSEDWKRAHDVTGAGGSRLQEGHKRWHGLLTAQKTQFLLLPAH